MNDLFNPGNAIKITMVIIFMMTLVRQLVKFTGSFSIAFSIFVLFLGLLIFWDTRKRFYLNNRVSFFMK